MTRLLASWSLAALLVLPQGALALGLGSVELRSALNQPLQAEIPLTDISAEELASVRVRAASLEAFERYGLERTALISDLSFDVTRDGAGRPIVRVRSSRPVREPFLTFLVEATWNRGRLLREYTVLLDPPDFMPEPERAEPVAAPRTGTGQDERAGRVAPRAAPEPETRPAPRETAPPPRRRADDGLYVVQRNETLWGVAQAVRPEQGLTTNQIMVALFEANPDAFDGNINRLRAGAELRVPSADQIRATSAGEATAAVQRQHEAWRDAPPATAAAREERLRLVPPDEAPAADAAPTREPRERTDPAATARVRELERESGELRDEVSTLASELDDTRRLLELRDEEMAALREQLQALQAASPDAPPVEDAPDAVPGVDLERDEIFVDDEPREDDDPAVAATDPAPTPTEPVTEPEPAAPTATDPAPVVTTPTLAERALGWLAAPALWIALGLLVVAAAGLLWVRRRRQAAVADDWDALADDVDDAGADVAADADLPTAETARDGRAGAAAGGAAAGAGAAAAAASGIAATRHDAPDAAEVGRSAAGGVVAAEVDEGDPLAEADFHMAYGLYDQAADLLADAVADHPERSDLRLKLAEVYFVWGNQEGFVDAARALREHVGDGAEWDKVMIMGKQLCPDDPLFEGQTAAGDIDVEIGDTGDSSILELDFDLDTKADAGDDAGDDATGDVDFAFGDESGDDDARAADEFTLGIGSQTATNIERSLTAGADDDEDAATAERPAMRDADAPTMESPALHGDADDDDGADSPTVERSALDADDWDDASTMETPTIESPRPGGFDTTDDDESLAATQESQTLRTPAPTAGEAASSESEGEYTAEIDLDDLGLDLEGLESELDGPDDFGSGDADGIAAGLDVSAADQWSGDVDAEDADGAGDTRSQPRPSFADPQGDFDAADAGLDDRLDDHQDDDTRDQPRPAGFGAADADDDSHAATEVGDDPFAATGSNVDTSETDTGISDPFAAAGGDSSPDDEFDDLLESALDGGDDATRRHEAGADPLGESTTRRQRVPDTGGDDDNLLSATGVTQVLDERMFDTQRSERVLGDDEATKLSPSLSDSGLRRSFEDDAESTARVQVLGDDAGDAGGADAHDPDSTSRLQNLSDLDFDLGDEGDTAGGDTVEQPRAQPEVDDEFASALFGDGVTGVDLDIGTETDVGGDAMGNGRDGEPETMTEVGTKLDLARAYIDMGDPDGARSILDEVLDEGDQAQRQEARQLIDSLSA